MEKEINDRVGNTAQKCGVVGLALCPCRVFFIRADVVYVFTINLRKRDRGGDEFFI